MNSAWFGLIGALIGGGASVLTILIQQKYQHRRELLKIASDIAREDWERRGRMILNAGGGRMPPIPLFVHYHQRVLEELAKGKFTPAKARQISEEQEALLKAYEQDGEAIIEEHLKRAKQEQA